MPIRLRNTTKTDPAGSRRTGTVVRPPDLPGPEEVMQLITSGAVAVDGGKIAAVGHSGKASRKVASSFRADSRSSEVFLISASVFSIRSGPESPVSSPFSSPWGLGR